MAHVQLVRMRLQAEFVTVEDDGGLRPITTEPIQVDGADWAKFYAEQWPKLLEQLEEELKARA